MFRRSVIFAILYVLAANATSTRQHVTDTSHMLVPTNWLAQHLSDRNLVILHVGANRASYDAGHIPGARFLALSDIAILHNGIPNQMPPAESLKATFERLGVGDRSRVVIYGDMFGLLAARTYFTLDYLGEGNKTALLDGGLEAWSKEHDIVKTVPAEPGPAVLTIHPRPELLIELATMRDIVPSGKAVLVDARPPMDYSGMGRGEGLPRTGHIPGAVNVFWAETLVSQQNPVFKPVSEIQARYAAAGVKPGAKVIVYCRGGIQAAHDYFTLKLAGFHPALYAGSFIEWSSTFGTPVETGAGGQR
ncbi:MAG TPA: sulfurtransferase [Candidatus Sulfotelmatobacter sp.]|nr:sulfurtransferase [Candidatus Sulfotelmatobacter sp.]